VLKIPIFKIRNAWVAGSSPASGLIKIPCVCRQYY
jgi:hypothetical protein